MPLTVTFDTNTLNSVVWPETAQRGTETSGAKIQAAIETMSRAQVERSVEFQHRSFQGQASIDFLETGEKTITELGEALRARLAIT